MCYILFWFKMNKKNCIFQFWQMMYYTSCMSQFECVQEFSIHPRKKSSFFKSKSLIIPSVFSDSAKFFKLNWWQSHLSISYIEADFIRIKQTVLLKICFLIEPISPMALIDPQSTPPHGIRLGCCCGCRIKQTRSKILKWIT